MEETVVKIYDSIIDTIGETPLVKVNIFSRFKGNYYVKLESFNPGGSSKDRIGITILDQAEREGLIKPGGTIVEATSGNTGLGLALIAIQRGYKVILVMPDKMSSDKMNLVKAVGCKVIVCPTEVEPDHPDSYYSVSKTIAENTPNSFYANQYHNEANPSAHYQTTGPEIWAQTAGRVTHFVAGVGTGGTISGTAKYLKEQNPNVKIIGIDPFGSILAHYHEFGTTDGIEAKSYKVEGVGEDIIPSNVHFDLIDDFVTVNDQESFDWTRKIAKEEGILVGPSSGLALAGVHKFASTISNEDSHIVILLPDTGERYLSKVFSDTWMRSNGFLPPIQSISDILTSKSANLPSLVYLQNHDTLRDAMNKIQKFRIDTILVKTQGESMKNLSSNRIYNLLLAGRRLETKLEDCGLKEISSIDFNASLEELKLSLVRNELVLVTINDEPSGIITREDLIDNLHFK